MKTDIFNISFCTNSIKFNDPYDTKPLLNPDKIDILVMQDNNFVVGKNDIKFFQQKFLSFMSDFRINCFTENDYSNILMWSHYADCHKGFCLEYDVQSDKFKNHLLNFIHPVIYSNDIYDLSEYIYCVIEKYKGKKKIINHSHLLLSALFKSTQWESEKEWRLVLTKDNKNDKFVDVDNPSAIYMGLNIENKYRKCLMAFACDKNIPIYEMFQKGNEYKLIAKEITENILTVGGLK